MKKKLLLAGLYFISMGLFLMANKMTPGIGGTSGNGNPAIVLLMIIGVLMVVIIVLWTRTLESITIKKSTLIISAILFFIHWIVAIYYQFGQLSKYKQVLADAYHEQFGFIDWEYIDSITSSILSIHVNNQFFNVNTYLMFFSLSLFISLLVVFIIKKWDLRNLVK